MVFSLWIRVNSLDLVISICKHTHSRDESKCSFKLNNLEQIELFFSKPKLMRIYAKTSILTVSLKLISFHLDCTWFVCFVQNFRNLIKKFICDTHETREKKEKQLHCKYMNETLDEKLAEVELPCVSEQISLCKGIFDGFYNRRLLA